MNSTTHWNDETLRQRIAQYAGESKVPARLRIHTDTSDFYRLDYDDVLILKGRAFFLRHYEREGRFGIDDQPKHWVRRAIDLSDGSLKVIKMVFHERFTAHFGTLEYECVRSPLKEARILELCAGNNRFMQGITLQDPSGNPVRVIDYIHGSSWPAYISALPSSSHEEYYLRYLPDILLEFRELVLAIRYLHEHGQTHGDIRRDHIIRQSDDGFCRWIDFDYRCMHRENLFAYDLAGLGNVLLFLCGGGEDITLQSARRMVHAPSLSREDMNIVFRNRVANLRKVFPYISEELNYMLIHFSLGARVFYQNTGRFLSDLDDALSSMGASTMKAT